MSQVAEHRIIDGISEESHESYLAGPGLSFSGLKEFRKTPAHYLASKSRESEETASQRLGTLAHMAILEFDRFKKTVKAIDGHRGKTEVKAAIASAEAEGWYVCKPDEYQDAMRMAKAVLNDPDAKALLSNGVAERSIRWTDPETGVMLKCRPDYLRNDGIVVDLKTYDDLSESNVQRQIHKMLYHWQSAHYLNGVNGALKLKERSTMFAHIFVDTKAFVCRVFVLDDASLEKANSEIRPLINAYAECLKTNNWPGYPQGIVTTSLPSYAW